MTGNRDIIQSNIRKQLALQSGQLQVSNQGGQFQWADGQGNPIAQAGSDFTNYGLSQSPARYVTNMGSTAYQLALGLFGGPNVPDSLITVLANMAVYYANQTGQPVSSLFKKGILVNDFLATINSIRLPTSQLGYQGINPYPSWANTPTLGPTIAAAISNS
jgi:hypothetical protein